MPFDAPRHAATPATTTPSTSLLYVLPAGTTDGTDADGSLAAEVSGLRDLGCRVIPISTNALTSGLDPGLAAEADAVGSAVARDGRSDATRNPFGLARATRLALAQRSLPASTALRLGSRIAAAARLYGCARIHAASADAAATAALIGGRLAGTPVSIASRGGEVYLGMVAPGIVAPDGDRDPAPIGVLQAMALQLPVVASALMGLREIVQPDSGHLVPAGQPSPLARGLRWLSIMPEEHRRRLGRAGRDRVLGGYTMAERAAAMADTLTRRAA